MKERGSYLSAVKGDELGVDKTKLITFWGREEKEKYEKEMAEGERNKLHGQNTLSSVKRGNGSRSRLEAWK